MAPDESLVRMRRSMEWAGILSRFAAVLWIMAAVVFLPAVGGTPLAFGFGMAAAEVLVNVLALVALRNVGHARYTRFSATLVAVDTALIIAMVYYAAGEPTTTFWPLLLIPVIIGAYRHQMAGALLAWAAVAAAGVVLYLEAPAIAGRAMPADLITFAPGLELVIAVMSGVLCQAHRSHLKQLADARAELREQALHDPLTGLGNRNRLHEHARSTLRSGESAAVLVLDLDGFKAVNDSLGHAAGDELLRVVADRLSAQVRDRDLVARLGGDEFVVMLHDAGAAKGREVADRLRGVLTTPIELPGQREPVRIDASIGVATAHDGDLDALLRAADAEMYRVKAAHHVLALS